MRGFRAAAARAGPGDLGHGGRSRTPFSGHPRAFESASGEFVGVYVPNWQPPELLDRVPAGNLAHLLYAFLHICGPGRLPPLAVAWGAQFNYFPPSRRACT